jgi:hypothetical protein
MIPTFLGPVALIKKAAVGFFSAWSTSVKAAQLMMCVTPWHARERENVLRCSKSAISASSLFCAYEVDSFFFADYAQS